MFDFPLINSQIILLLHQNNDVLSQVLIICSENINGQNNHENIRLHSRIVNYQGSNNGASEASFKAKKKLLD